MTLHLNKLESPAPNDALFQALWNRYSGFGDGENAKSLQTDEQTDWETFGRTTGDQKSPLRLLAQVN